MRQFEFDESGRVHEERYSPNPGPWPYGSSDYAPHGFSRVDKYNSFGAGLLSSMATEVDTPEGTWRYTYDIGNRRRQKESPIGAVSFFTYDLSQALLEERRIPAVGEKATVENYVYLGGQLVLVARARVDPAGGSRQLAGSGCEGLQHDLGPLSCGWRYPVVDYLGKPIVALDDEKRIVWAGEYQPYGAKNRRDVFGGVLDRNDPDGHNRAWPGYTFWTASGVVVRDEAVAELSQQRVGMELKMRARFALLDVVPTEDRVELRDLTSGSAIWIASQWQGGPVRSPWLSVSGTALEVRFKTHQPTQSCQPRGTPCSGVGTCCGVCNTFGFCQPLSLFSPGLWFAGAQMEGFEYSRHQQGAEAYNIPLGFPGMYYDEEIEKYENWNRHYNPATGHYLSPEPMLVRPEFVLSAAESGASIPAYAYAANNPLTNTDSTGLWTVNGQCTGFSTAIALARQWLGCDRGASQSSPGDLTCGAAPNSCDAAKSCFGSCDICSILAVGTWPTMTPVGSATRPRGRAGSWYAQWTDPWIEPDGTYSTMSGGQWDLYRWQCSAANAPILAGTLIHEAAHACAVGAPAAQADAFADDVQGRSCTGWNIECACVPKPYKSRACR